MTKVDFYKIKEEICVFLRNKDIISTSVRGVTTVTDNFDGDNSTVEFTLSNVNVKNIRSITVDSSPLSYGHDYLVDYQTAKVTFITAPSTGTNNINIVYDYGTTDRIYPDFPQIDIKQNSVPRIGFDIISGTTQEDELGGGSNRSNYIIQLSVFDDNIKDAEGLITDTRSEIAGNKKGFYHFYFITPIGLNPILIPNWSTNKIYTRSQDFEVWSLNETAE